ncbi:NAD(P)H-hydrate dehydratase [Maribellus maritimus]|uniref:NAD(P)H-hydrate dehydratase n=1 Tax=Maribellus maritimus TaxID=2870838 RepID=UPI001EEC6A43|nr:NAD(P)H-hydrate dehydratase [Maribellus maritimus]MCG6185872.1 NAD(P)H-hydrate dehydratase [Maribellus maritimus]
MKLFTTKQIAGIDKFTIENEPISDIDLMERAALQITHWLVKRFSTEQKMVFFAGPGNNGGDALAIARQLANLDFVCEVFLLDFGKELKGSPAMNWKGLEEQNKVKLVKFKDESGFPELGLTDVILDGMFGSGLSRPLEGFSAAIVGKINQLENTKIAIDIPSGLMGEDNSSNIPGNIIKADFTLTFQFPKISFLFSENEIYTGRWEALPIGLHPGGMKQTPSNIFFIEEENVKKIIVSRSKFAHKGNFGHALLIAGSFGKMGAAVLASRSCLRAGVGLLTTHIPRLGYSVIQSVVPEAMTSIDQHDAIFTEFPDLSSFSAIGVGPGIDKKRNSQKALCELLEKAKVPLVIDADGLNILSENSEWLQKLPGKSILTPHPGEFKRLVGNSSNSYERIQQQKEFAQKYHTIVILKGAYTVIAMPNGQLFFNSTGNPGMATAGSGDTLTGILLGLLAQGISSEEAAIAGVYLHGLAGDLAAREKSEPALIAGDITDYLGKAFIELNKETN